MLTLPAGALVLTLAASPGGLPGNLSLGLPPLHLAAATADEAPALDFIDDEEEARIEPGPLRERSDFGVRVLAETGSTIMLGTSGAILGFGAGAAICAASREKVEEDDDDGMDCLGPGIIGGLAGLWVGGAAGTTLGGHFTGADGSFFAALLGSLVGAAAGGVLTQNGGLAALFGTIGSITAYELSVTSLPEQ